MGMYTEIVVKCRLIEDLPSDIDEVLNYLFKKGDEIEVENLPKHPFFNCIRWNQIGSCSSYYHIPFAYSEYAIGYIFSRSDLKNYDNEIDLFFDWINPYIDEMAGTCIGWSWYEEERAPTLVYKK